MSNQKVVISCGECQWFNPLKSHEGKAGECRTDRPTVLVIPSASMDRHGRPMSSEINVCFPTVPVDLWCGRFVPRKLDLSVAEISPGTVIPYN